jgi:hypothetical protein
MRRLRDKGLILSTDPTCETKEREIDRLARADRWTPLPPAGAPAYSGVTTCQNYGVALRIDENGNLMIGKADGTADELTHQWPSLRQAIEAHLGNVAALVKAETGCCRSRKHWEHKSLPNRAFLKCFKRFSITLNRLSASSARLSLAR